MDAFPAFFPLAGLKVAVAGDGEAAEAKARLFDGSPATVVRLTADDALEAGAFDGARLAFVAGSEAFCVAAAEAARGAGALVNAVDRPNLSDFNTPALVDRGEVVVGIGTAGAAPMMAALLRNDLEAKIPEGAGRIAALFKRLQDEVRAAFPDLDQRRGFLREAYASPAAEAAAAGDMAGAERLLRAQLTATRAVTTGRLLLLRADGPADHLSLKAARALAEVDVLVADAEATPQILALVRRDAERVAPEGADLASLSGSRTVARLVAGPIDDLAATLAGAEILPVAAP